jgi:hypothetical protein
MSRRRLQPYEFSSLLGGYTFLEHKKLEGIDDEFGAGGEAFYLKAINILERMIQDAASTKRNIPILISTIMEAQNKGYYIPPELTIKSILRTESKGLNYDILSSIISLNDINEEQKDWIRTQVIASGYKDFNRAISAILQNPTEKSVKSSAKDIEDKFDFLLELAGGNFDPTNHTLAAALSSNIDPIIHKIFSLKDTSKLSKEDWVDISKGIEVSTSDSTLNIAATLPEPLMEDISKKNNINNDMFLSMKNLLSVKKSLYKLAELYFNKIIKDEEEKEWIKNISGKKQLTFFLSASNTDPYSLLSCDISEKINKLCMEIIASQ